MADESNSTPFDIDPNRLDQMWISQPRRARAAGVREADARHAHAQAKAALDVTAARLTLAIRKNPGNFDLRDKATVDEIEAAVVVHEYYQAALVRFNRAEYEMNVAKAETTAYVDRRKALERLVDLLGLEYHSEREPVPKTDKGRERNPTRLMDPGIQYDPADRD